MTEQVDQPCAACTAGATCKRNAPEAPGLDLPAFAFTIGVAEAMHQEQRHGAVPFCPEHARDVAANLDGMIDRDGRRAPACVLCGRENDDGIFIGCGTGSGQRFAHLGCYDTAKRIAAFVRTFEPHVAEDVQCFILTGQSLAVAGGAA
jgi:hypothetical protein